ncbi:hypothetical protein SAMN05216359_10710 [Roseateles sp. YR242]|uniref:hypothetical protein n=1 Tax=Roseateles sp. YR242 TaxID=1855305 RepID=UPI0008B9DFF6|nr:hypothetical protein [Roseateles sp. YR242]SEL26629.1 hypothetical protein SAMN05216359_10710 [Roseateles sp. YR242]
MSAVLTEAKPSGGHAQIFRVVLRATRLMGGLLLFLLVLLLVLVAFFGGRESLTAAAGPASALAMGGLWWVAFFALLAQNHPVAARLVPGQLKQLREVAVVVFLGVSASCGAVLALTGLPGPAWTIAAGVAFTALAMATRWPWLWVAVWVVPATAAWWVPSDARAWMWLRAVHIYEEQPVSMAAFVLVMMAMVIWRLFQAGGPAHERSWRRAQLMQRLTRNQVGNGRSVTALSGGFAIVSVRAFSWLRTLWQEHLIRSGRPTARSVVARAELGANPHSHWSLVVGSSALVLGMIFLAIAVTLVVLGGRVNEGMRSAAQGLAFGVIGMLVNPSLSAATILFKRRREQGLLLLLPGLPRGAALNRQLARRQLTQYVLCWATGMAAVLALEALTQFTAKDHGGPSFLIGWAFNYAALTLPLGVVQWRDWSVQRQPNNSATVLYMLAVMGGMVLLSMLSGPLHLTHVRVLALSVCLTAVLAVWRWPVVTRSASFWPVGRWS